MGEVLGDGVRTPNMETWSARDCIWISRSSRLHVVVCYKFTGLKLCVCHILHQPRNGIVWA